MAGDNILALHPEFMFPRLLKYLLEYFLGHLFVTSLWNPSFLQLSSKPQSWSQLSLLDFVCKLLSCKLIHKVGYDTRRKDPYKRMTASHWCQLTGDILSSKTNSTLPSLEMNLNPRFGQKTINCHSQTQLLWLQSVFFVWSWSRTWLFWCSVQHFGDSCIICYFSINGALLEAS